MSDIVSYHPVSPDPLVPGCQNTRQEGTDGVVFQGIEPAVGTYCFVGRQSVLEAVAVLYDLTPDAVDRVLTKPRTSPKRKD